MTQPTPRPITAIALQLDAEQLRLVPPLPATPYAAALGWRSVSQAFGQRMPNALALENAIATVEDAVMPAVRALPAPPFDLQTNSPLLHQVAQVAGADMASQPVRLSRDATEHLFNRLADQAQRPGYAAPDLPQNPEFAAALLILREAMHHWGVEWLEILD
jgi:hypothetical protein